MPQASKGRRGVLRSTRKARNGALADTKAADLTAAFRRLMRGARFTGETVMNLDCKVTDAHKGSICVVRLRDALRIRDLLRR